MALAPWKVRVTADGAGTLAAVHATVELVDRATGAPECDLPPSPWQHFEPESVDAIYTDGDPAFWPDTSGNGRDIDGVQVRTFGTPGVPAPYRPNLLNGYGGIALGPPEWDDPTNYEAGTYYSERALVEGGSTGLETLDDIGPSISLLLVARRDLMATTFTEAILWAPFEFINTPFYLGVADWSIDFSGNDGTSGMSISVDTPASPDWFVLTGSIGPDISRLWLNGSEIGTAAGVAGPWNHYWTFYYPGDQAVEFGIWPYAFTVEQHEDVWCALSQKYGLS